MGYLPLSMRLVPALAFLASASLLGAVESGASASTLPVLRLSTALTLEQAIDRALQQNLGLAITRLDALRSLDSVDVSEAVFDPTFSWTNQLTGGRTPTELLGGVGADRAYNSDVSLSRKFTWGGVLTLGAGTTRTWKDSGYLTTPSLFDVASSIAYTQPLLAGGWQAVNLTSLISARQSALRSRLILRAAALDLIRDAEVAYWSLAGARTLVALRETSLRSAESLLTLVKARRELGDATVLEELQAQADVSGQQVGVLNARQSLDGAEMTLRRLLGQGTAADIEQALVVAELPRAGVAPPVSFQPWIKTVAAFDFDTAIQLTNITQAEALVEQAQQNNHPSLNLTLSGAAYGNPATGLSGGYDSYRNTKGWNNAAALTLSFPLGFREAEANLRSASRARRQAELHLADTRLSLIYSARSTWRDLEASRARVSAATSALELQRQSYEGERARYDAGQSDILRVLQAQAALDAAQVNWVQALLDARASSAKVARLDGSILPRHGFTMDAVEAKLGAGSGLDDRLPSLPDHP